MPSWKALRIFQTSIKVTPRSLQPIGGAERPFLEASILTKKSPFSLIFSIFDREVRSGPTKGKVALDFYSCFSLMEEFFSRNMPNFFTASHFRSFLFKLGLKEVVADKVLCCSLPVTIIFTNQTQI